MEFTLFDGSTVQVTPDMAKAIRRARPTPAIPGRLCLHKDEPSRNVNVLGRRSLAFYDGNGGEWVLTSRGAWVRSLLMGQVSPEAGSGCEPGEHRATRITAHPDLSSEQVRNLSRALSRRHSRERCRNQSAPSANSMGQGCGLIFILAVSGLALVFFSVDEPVVSFALLLSGSTWAAAKGGSHLLEKRRGRQENVPGQVIASFQGRFIDAEILDERSRDLLERTQNAVDTVLESPLHHQGLLLDTVRNRVVLADIEWSLAESLLRQSKNRKQIAETPTPGERSRRAAERARTVLEEDVQSVLSRIRTLEAYAGKVRAAEIEEQDRRAAAELEAIADSTAQAQAVVPQQDEALESLMQAQGLALQVAALADSG